MTKTPTSMATQHPDNADRYIAIQNEPEEAIAALTSQAAGGLGIEEIMVDYEGKLTPYHQISQIALGLIDQGIIPGEEVRITPRISNSKKEPIFRQLMSIMSFVETNILAYKMTEKQAILETIIPMVENGHELIQLQDRINSVIELGNKNYDIQFPLNSIKIIPLVESVPALIHVDTIIDEYYQDLIQKGIKLDEMRIMFARSDSAMSYGMISSVLSVLIATDKSYKWSKLNGVDVMPILGCGSLPFRGHLTEANIDSMMKNYAGIHTFTIQSGLRYDYGENCTKTVVEKLRDNPYRVKTEAYEAEDIELMQEFIGISTKYYMQTFLKAIESVERISEFIPKNRDRLSSAKTGLEYIREIACLHEVADLVKDETLKKELREINTDIQCMVPRAISFTAAMYTMGMPPEFIGTGRCLNEILDKYGRAGINKLLKFYPQILDDIKFALKFVNTKVSKGIIPEEARQEYIEDVDLVCRILDISNEFDEANEDMFYHTLLMSIRPILLHLIGKQVDLISDSEEEKRILNEWIIKMGKIRGSLG